MESKTYLINFLKYVGKSVLASVLISLVGFCLLTKTFPPDFGRLHTLYVSFKKLSALSDQIRNAQNLKKNTEILDPEAEEKNLENLFEHRKQMLNLLSEMNLMKSANKTESNRIESTVPDESDPRAIVLSKESYNNLRLQIKELNVENEKLRQDLVNSRK